MLQTYQFIRVLRHTDTMRAFGRSVENRCDVLSWLVKVAERCRISDAAWHRAVMLLDRSHFRVNQYHKAAASLYLCSKFQDEKYLVADVFLEGVLLTKSNALFPPLTL